MQSAKASISPHTENALTIIEFGWCGSGRTVHKDYQLGGGAFSPLLIRSAPSRCSSREHPPYGPDLKMVRADFGWM
jgi:hypothetical protein